VVLGLAAGLVEVAKKKKKKKNKNKKNTVEAPSSVKVRETPARVIRCPT